MWSVRWVVIVPTQCLVPDTDGIKFNGDGDDNDNDNANDDGDFFGGVVTVL